MKMQSRASAGGDVLAGVETRTVDEFRAVEFPEDVDKITVFEYVRREKVWAENRIIKYVYSVDKERYRVESSQCNDNLESITVKEDGLIEFNGEYATLKPKEIISIYDNILRKYVYIR